MGRLKTIGRFELELNGIGNYRKFRCYSLNHARKIFSEQKDCKWELSENEGGQRIVGWTDWDLYKNFEIYASGIFKEEEVEDMKGESEVSYIVVDGPFSDCNRDGDEVGLYIVFYLSSNEEELWSNEFSSLEVAEKWAGEKADELGVELVMDATQMQSEGRG